MTRFIPGTKEIQFYLSLPTSSASNHGKSPEVKGSISEVLEVLRHARTFEDFRRIWIEHDALRSECLYRKVAAGR